MNISQLGFTTLGQKARENDRKRFAMRLKIALVIVALIVLIGASIIQDLSL